MGHSIRLKWAKHDVYHIHQPLQRDITYMIIVKNDLVVCKNQRRRSSCVCLFVCFVALRPKSTAMVIAGRSVHLTTLFSWASLNKQLTSNRAHTFACN